MITGQIRHILICFCIVVPISFSHAEGYAVDQTKPVEKELEQVVYIPPPSKQLKPEIRIAKGGVRGDADCSSLPTITLLVPNHVAFTLKSQPVLFFHSTATIKKSITLTIIDPELDKPLIEQALIEKVKTGLNKINFSDYGVSLDTNKEYEWSLQINQETDSPMKCYSVARAYVKREISDVDLENKNSTSEADSIMTKVHKLATKGIWYDALATIMMREKVVIKDSYFTGILNTFLEQGELEVVF